MRKALNIPLEEFLRPFFGPGERICLRIFDDRKTGTFKGAKLETSLSGLPGLMDKAVMDYLRKARLWATFITVAFSNTACRR